ncbi:sporulation protein [Streptomyces sp. NBC_01255]|uniref:sporulation protein n=1 Tax=Streptomyces sp. NBC_01255 TaxID=2903798 RepID=UPI002E349BFB|nr:sporulation protein [Streptomyces sp. NBC_01255]
MTGSDTPDRPVPQASAVFGEPVTSGGVTVIPVAGSASPGARAPRPQPSEPAPAKEGGGAGARPRGHIEIKDGTATYRPFRAPWVKAAVPLAALLAGAVAPLLVRRLARRRPR